MPWTKEEKNDYNKKYYEKNKEKIKEHNIENKEKIKEYDTKYYIENKEKIKERCKEYYIENKEKIKEHKKKYNKTEIGKKTKTISKWINIFKIKFDDRTQAEYYYNSYINTHSCNWCNKDFKDSLDRCMDHCHTCGLPRAIICRSCNNKDIVPCVNCLL